MSKKSSKKTKNTQNNVTSIDEITASQIVDLSGIEDDGFAVIDDMPENDSADDAGSENSPSVTSDDLDAYLSDGAIGTYSGSNYASDGTANATNNDSDDICPPYDFNLASSLLDDNDDSMTLDDIDDVMDKCDSDTSSNDNDANDNGSGIDRSNAMTDDDHRIMSEMLKIMDNIDYDEIPDGVRIYDDMLNGALQLRHETAESMYETGEAYRYADDIDMRAFMCYGATVPVMASEPIDKLCVKYGLGIHDSTNREHSISDGDYEWKKGQSRGLLHFETIPTTDKHSLRDNRRDNPDTAAIDELIAKGYSKGRHLKKSFVIDGEAIRQNAAEGEKWGFDTRQCWNLDTYIPTILYPRFMWLHENAHGFEAMFKTQEEYDEKVMLPILDALELHLVLYTIGDGEQIIDTYCEKNNLSMVDNCLINARAMQRIKHGYSIIANHLFGFWD